MSYIKLFSKSLKKLDLCTAYNVADDVDPKELKKFLIGKVDAYSKSEMNLDSFIWDILAKKYNEIRPLNLKKGNEINSDIDIIVYTVTERVSIIDRRNNKYDIVVFEEIEGNCVDKFTETKLLSFVETIKIKISSIQCRQCRRIFDNEYHNTDTFEKDFSDLTAIQETARYLDATIREFKENLTYNKYTE